MISVGLTEETREVTLKIQPPALIRLVLTDKRAAGPLNSPAIGARLLAKKPLHFQKKKKKCMFFSVAVNEEAQKVFSCLRLHGGRHFFSTQTVQVSDLWS